MSAWELILNPLAQDPAYHLFADQRRLLGIPHFWNVVSNLPFVIVAVVGMKTVLRHTASPLYPAWLAVFVGVGLTGLGSGWYHLDPNNDSLFWDRLAMMVGFMGLVAVVLGEYVNARLAKLSLVPLLLAGAGSVIYWIHTETLGAGDLRPYSLAQFLPVLVLPIIVIARRERSDLGKYLFIVFLAYAVAKAAEVYDHEVYAVGQLLSGHTLKHLLAAFGLYALVVGLRRRQHG